MRDSRVKWAVGFYDKNKDMLAPRLLVPDLGTGYGSLLIAILNQLWHDYTTRVEIDVLREALELAALGLNRSVWTLQGRFSSIYLLKHEPFNLVVCNPPPYHMQEGRKILDAATVGYGPDDAIFVEKEDALVYYHDILSGLHVGKLLVPGGLLVFEVFGDNVKAVPELMAVRNMENIR
jgi:methylase of polypeptide subunit release factors